MRIAIATVIAALASPALAQQSQDPQVLVYRQLKIDADDRLAQTVAQYERLIADSKKQNDDLKAKCGAACNDNPKKPDPTAE